MALRVPLLGLQQLHQQGSIERMNQRLQRRGLGTIQTQDTDPESGERWQVDRITMTSLHTAKLRLAAQAQKKDGPLERGCRR